MKSLIKRLIVGLVFILIGCKQSDKEVATIDKVEDTVVVASEGIDSTTGSDPQEDADQTPSDKIEEIVEEEDTIFYLTPVATNAAYSVSEGVIYGDSLDDTGSTVFSNVDMSKSLQDWSIELEINHPYNSWFCIELDNDYWLTGYFKQGEWYWSDLLTECSYIQGLPYTYDEVIDLYGNQEVKQGNNFTLHMVREKSWTVRWFIGDVL